MSDPESDYTVRPMPYDPSKDDYKLVNLPDRGDVTGEAIPLPDRGDATGEAVPLPDLAPQPELTDDEIEPPIVRHDPYAYMRKAPWMNRKSSPQARSARLLREELEAFPVIEGREPSGADVDAIAKRVADYMIPIVRREQVTDMVYDVLDEKRQARIAEKRKGVGNELLQHASHNDVLQGVGSGPEVGREPPARRGIAPNVEPPSGPERSHIVVLPDGTRIPDESSPTGFVMAPAPNLDNVAKAGHATGKYYRELLANPATAPLALAHLAIAVRRDLAQGGSLDYQRERNPAGDFNQLRHFKNVANVNVGLYMQQAGLGLDETLWIAGKYASRYSSNTRPNEPYSLHPDQKKFMEIGFEIGHRQYGSGGASP